MNCHDKFQITCQGNAKSHGNPRKLAAPRRFGSDRPITNGFFFLTLQHFFVSAVWSRRLAWPLSLSWFLLVRLKINDHVLYSRHVPDSSQRLPGKGVKRTFPSTIVFLILSTLPSPPLPSDAFDDAATGFLSLLLFRDKLWWENTSGVEILTSLDQKTDMPLRLRGIHLVLYLC